MRADESAVERAALLVYLPQAFRLAEDDPAFLRHQNLRRCRDIAAVLDEAGFLVDVAWKRDDSLRARRDYDLVVSERVGWEEMERPFSDDAVHVFLATSQYHPVHNRKIRRRHELLASRRTCSVEVRRIFGELFPALVGADALVGPGNEHTLGTWRAEFDGPVLPFDNAALREIAPPAKKTSTQRAPSSCSSPAGARCRRGSISCWRPSRGSRHSTCTSAAPLPTSPTSARATAVSSSRLRTCIPSAGSRSPARSSKSWFEAARSPSTRRALTGRPAPSSTACGPG